jgi:hypothetical protein
MIYTDPKYLEWCGTQESMVRGMKEAGWSNMRRKRNHTVITAGANWANWKDEKKEWHCKSFHYVKQIYDTMAKRATGG